MKDRMKTILMIALWIIISSPVWAEHVYTNSSLKKYDQYKNQTSIKTTAPTTTRTIAPTTTNSTQSRRGKIIIKDQSIRWTDISGSATYMDYAWKVKLRNTFDESKNVYIEFNLLDKKGFVVEMTNENVTIGPHKTSTFRGTGMLKTRLALQVKRTSVKTSVR